MLNCSYFNKFKLFIKWLKRSKSLKLNGIFKMLLNRLTLIIKKGNRKMKKNKIFLIALSLLASISFAQQQVKYGLGFEFHTLPTAFMMENNTSQMGIYFPMETASGLLIEPKLTYSNSSTETDYDSYYNGYNSYDSDTKLTINNYS